GINQVNRGVVERQLSRPHEGAQIPNPMPPLGEIPNAKGPNPKVSNQRPNHPTPFEFRTFDRLSLAFGPLAFGVSSVSLDFRKSPIVNCDFTPGHCHLEATCLPLLPPSTTSKATSST